MPHGLYCFCTDCCEAWESNPPDFPEYDEWRRAFPDLPWGEPEGETSMSALNTKSIQKAADEVLEELDTSEDPDDWIEASSMRGDLEQHGYEVPPKKSKDT